VLRPLRGTLYGLLQTGRLAVKGFVVVDIVGIKDGVQGRVPSALETYSQKPVGICHSISSKGNEWTLDFLLKKQNNWNSKGEELRFNSKIYS
jgi:hypothetical protein